MTTTSSRMDAGKMQKLMFKRRNIRNIAVIAHVDHGKSTLTDALVCRAGLIPEKQAGTKLFTHARDDEIERGITIKSSAVSMHFELSDSVLGSLDREGNEFLVNLIDSPGHVDFSSEVTAALRVTDGALVVVDVVSGVSSQTETVLRQALSERIKPVLVINKLDRAILEQKLEPSRLYARLVKIIEDVNYLIGVYSSSSDNDETTTNAFVCDELHPSRGNVAFAAGRDGWAFTLTQFAEIYNRMKKQASSSLVDRLWGDNYFDATTNKWTTSSQTGRLRRGFEQYVLEPVYKVLELCCETRLDELDKFADKLNVQFKLKPDERDSVVGKELMSRFMKRWLPAADALLELVCVHLPSPLAAQRYRCANLYEGPLDDEAAIGIRECDSQAHLVVYVSKMLPDPVDKTRFFAFGRVFSGTAQPGMNVRIMTPDYKPDEPKSDSGLSVKNLGRCMCMVGQQPLSFDRIPCGNVIALAGLDKYLHKSGTISTYEHAHNIRTMKFTVSPVVRVAVDPVNAADLPKFLEGLKRLSRSDQLVQCSTDKGQYVIAGAGELHLDICLRDLEKTYARVPIKRSEPIVTYKETVGAVSSQPCLAKSNNGHNRVWLSAEPLGEEFCQAVDEKKLTLNQDVRERAKYLHEHHGFDLTEARKIWCFGPHQFDANMLVDVTRGVQMQPDVRDTLCAGFQWATEEGVLCQEEMRGVRFNLTDLVFHQDSAHRKGAQLIPTMRRAMMAAVLAAEPRLLEPVFLVDIQCPDACIGTVYTILNRKRGQMVDERKLEGTLMNSIKAYVPVNESTGLTGELQGATSGKAFMQCSFDHWQLLPGDPFDAESRAGQVCAQVRRVKGLRDNMPQLNDYLDKL